VSAREPLPGSARTVAREARSVNPRGGAWPLRPVVLKLGGRALEAPGALAELADALHAHAGPLVLVHGGGAEVSAWCERLGLAARFENGLRVTTGETLDVAVAVLAGLANKRLVAALRERGVDAVGLAALDGGIAEFELHEQAARLGRVGRIARVQPGLIDTLLAQGRVPVLASIGERDGALLNVNADDLAAALAPALAARALVLLSDVPGVQIGDECLSRLTRADAERALAHRDVSGGMRAKLAAAHAALEGGVAHVCIGAWQGPGTLRALLSGAGASEATPAPRDSEALPVGGGPR